MKNKYLKMDDSYKNESEAQIVRKALEQCSDYFKYNINNITTAINMRNFLYVDGQQWTGADKADRGLRAKTCHTLNVVEPIIRKLISEERASDPQCTVIPMDENIPTKIIKLKTGLHESIVYESNGKMVFANCYADMLECGFGQINIVSVPEKTTSFNNVLRYECPEDVLYSYWDMTDKHPNKVNGDYAGNFFFMAKTTAEMTYDKEDIKSIGMPNYWGTNFYQFMRKDILVLLCHYRKCYGKITMVKLDGGAEMPLKIYNQVKKEIMEEYAKNMVSYHALVETKRKEAEEIGFSAQRVEFLLQLIPAPQIPEIPAIIKRKSCIDFYVEQLILSQNKVLKRTMLPIKKLPQLYVGGNDKRNLGVTVTQPYAANAVTPQRLINYIVSEQIDNIGRSMGFRVLAHEEAVENREHEYIRPSISNLCTFKSVDGQAVPPRFEYVSGVDLNLVQVLEEQMSAVKAVLGRYNDSQGQESNAYGYEAILARQMNGDIATGIYPENLNNGIAESAKQVFEWMPFDYDTERGLLIRNSEGQPEFVTINRPTGEEDELGNLILENDMRLGSFSVEVNGGLSFATQRLAGMKFLENLMLGDPNLRSVCLDLYISMAPFAFKNELIKRLKETDYIDPRVIAQEEGEPPPKPKPNPLQELEKLKVMSEIKQFQQQEFKTKMEGLKAILDYKIEVEKMKSDEVKEEIQLMSDTVEAYASSIESLAKTQNSQIGDATEMMRSILEREMDALKSQNVESDKKILT